MGRRGRKRRLAIESEYWLLLAAGVETAEACKRLGIGRKTRYRRRTAQAAEGITDRMRLGVLTRQGLPWWPYRIGGEGRLTEGGESYNEDAFLAWRDAMHRLTSEREAARSWRRGRYKFAYRLGEALVSPTRRHPGISGPVVYGVWLSWGLLYIGQTSQAERRLRDLPVGESHHLANTFPPEIWHKVVVVAWPQLAQARPLAGKLSPEIVNLALEHALQEQLRPLVNSERRTADGGWRDVVWKGSRSRGARAAHEVVDLVEAVRTVWDKAAGQSAEESDTLTGCRVVFPAELLPRGHQSSPRR